MDICVYVHVNKIIRCEYNNGGGGGVGSEIIQTWGGACPKSLKTPDLAQDWFGYHNPISYFKTLCSVTFSCC